MGKRDLAVVVTAAAVTALTAMLFVGRLTVAEEPGAPAEIPWPTLKGEGYAITLKHDKATYAAGEKPALILECENSIESPQDLEVTLMMTSTSPGSEMSRMAPISTIDWQSKISWTVEPGKSTRSIAVEKEAPVGKIVGFSASIGDQSVYTRPIGAPAIPVALVQAE